MLVRVSITMLAAIYYVFESIGNVEFLAASVRKKFQSLNALDVAS